MVLLISLLLASLMIFIGGKWIREHSGICYLICIAISLCVIVGVWLQFAARLTGLASTLALVLTQGGFAGALFIYIMYASAVQPKARLKKAVIPIRGQLSIMASILTLGHNIAYGRTYFVLLFTQAPYMRLNILLAAVCSLIMILIMLPLFITSFIKIRRKMKPASWKKLQRLAYVFYCLLYTHIMLLYMPSAIEGKGNSILNVVLYSIVYLAYGCMRISRQLEKKKKKSPVKLVRILFLAAFAGIIAAMIIPAVQRAQASSEAEILSEGSGSNNTDMSEDQSTDENQTQDENEPEDENNPDGHANGTNSTEQTNAEERIVSAVKEGDKALDIVYQDGKYTGSGTGYNGRLTVAVVIEGGKIADVYLKGSVDDEPYLTDAADGIFPAVIESGTAEVDAVSNATTTSHALIDAIRDALEKAQ